MSYRPERPVYAIVGGVGRWVRPYTPKPYTPWFTYYAMYRSAMMVQDLAMKALQAGNVGAISEKIPQLLGHDFDVATKQLAAGKTGDVVSLRKAIINTYQGLYENWKSGIWHGVGTTYSSAMEQFTAAGQLLYAYKSLMYQIAVTPRIRRHWMSSYTPTVPDDYMAWILWRRGEITETKFKQYCSWEGWDSEGIKLLKAAWRTIPNIWAAAQMYLRNAISEKEYLAYGVMNGWTTDEASKVMSAWLSFPSSREAFYMHRRAIVDETTRNRIYQAQGYLSSWWPLISENYEHIPNPLNTFKLYYRGKLGYDEYANYIYQNGWPKTFAALFEALYQNIPTSQEAFYMWMKGILTTSERNTAYQAYGWHSNWHQKITENYYYVPTVYDLFRLADYAQVDEIWATDVMKRRGVKDSDIAKILPALRIRPIRNEISRQVTVWINRYSLGWILPSALETALQTMVDKGYIQTSEKTLITEEAYLKYEDELMNEQITILMWYFRMGAITEQQYLDNLKSLGIRTEKANLMVEEQKAMGYYGYY